MKEKNARQLKPATPSWRMFCAIELPESLRHQLGQHIERLRQTVPQAHASWSRPENIHLTLKFLGDVKQHLIPRLSAAADRASEQFAEFQIDIAGAGAFPKQSQPRVLWIGVDDPNRKLASLQGQFEKECAQEGFAKEERAFRPHLTLARIRNPEGSRTLAEAHQQLGFAAQTFLATELVIFRSELSSQGSKYTAISRHKFQSTDYTDCAD